MRKKTDLSLFQLLNFFAALFLAPFLALLLAVFGLSAGVVHLATILITLIAVCLLMIRLPKQVLKNIWGIGSWRAFGFGALSAIFVYPAVSFIGLGVGKIVQFFWPFPEQEQAAVMSVREVANNPVLFALYGVALVFLVPFIEEFLFRGVLQSWLREKIGIWLAVLSTSLFFSFLHYTPSSGANNWQYVVPLFFFSLFLGFLYEQQRSLWAPLGLHVIFNGATITMISFQLYGM